MSLPVLKWKPSPNFNSRHGARVDLLVLHDTEGSYEGSIDWFQKPESKVSAHFVIKEDGSEATQMVHLADRAWHVCSFNSRSVGFEMAGLAAKGFFTPEWQAAADILAFHLHYLQIPMRWARSGVGPGFCSHYDLGKAGGGHRDPTTNVTTWDGFVKLVGDSYNKASFPSHWEADEATSVCRLSESGK